MSAAAKKFKQAPYGWEFLPAPGGFIPRPVATEIWVIRYIRQLRAFGCDPDEIAQELRYDKLRPRSRAPWSTEEVAELLDRDDSLFWRHWKDQVPL
jgi:hypothetical protein